jgi:hypothetical protein
MAASSWAAWRAGDRPVRHGQAGPRGDLQDGVGITRPGLAVVGSNGAGGRWRSGRGQTASTGISFGLLGSDVTAPREGTQRPPVPVDAPRAKEDTGRRSKGESDGVELDR